MRQFCDLNVQESTSYPNNLKNIKHLISLGYNVVALNRYYGLPKKEKQKKKGVNDTDNVDNYVISVKNLHDKLKADIDLLRLNNDGAERNVVDSELQIPENFKLLSRLTLDIDHMDQLSYLRSHSNKKLMETFDIIAVNPRTEPVFRSLMEGKLDFDVIYFPMEERLPFKLHHHQIGVGTGKGLVFEINYSRAIKSQSLRRYIFSNSQNLVSKTKHGFGITVSSGGESVMDFRAPPDVANLCNLFRLNGSSGLDAISKTPRKMLVRALLRKETFKGAVKVEKLVDVPGNVGDEPLSKKRKIENS